MCLALGAEEPRRSTIPNLLFCYCKHCPLKVSGHLSSSPRKDEQRRVPEWPPFPLTRESKATNKRLKGHWRAEDTRGGLKETPEGPGATRGMQEAPGEPEGKHGGSERAVSKAIRTQQKNSDTAFLSVSVALLIRRYKIVL
jgi:hypothetical protein